jgi:hypothetical protein
MKNKKLTMNNKRRAFPVFFFLLSLIITTLVFIGCQDIFNEPDFVLPEPEIISVPGKGYFLLVINGVDAGRTILPASERNVFARYKLEFFAEGNNDHPAESIIRTGTDLSQPILLLKGTWDLYVTAYMDEDLQKPAAYGNLKGIVIAEGAVVKQDVILTAVIEEGEGTFSWEIDYPGNVTIASLTITPLNDSASLEQTLYFVGGTPLVAQDNTLAPLTLNTGYYWVTFNLRNSAGESAQHIEILHIYKNMDSHFQFTFTPNYFSNVIIVTNNADSGLGSLREAITILNGRASGGTIVIDRAVGTIELTSALPQITRNINIEGNGITLTRSSSWTSTSTTSQLLRIISSGTVSVSRVHFKNGRATDNGAAIDNRGTLTLESCIFSGNRTSISSASGGAIYNFGTMTVRGCTFYGNGFTGIAATSGRGGAIYNTGTSATLSLSGNLFYGNTAGSVLNGPVVFWANGTVTSLGYNMVDVPLGAANNQSGFAAVTGDVNIGTGLFQPPVSPVSFRLLPGSEAEGIIPESFLTNYPVFDFYGNSITAPASAGAVQEAVNRTGFFLDVTANNAARGSLSIVPEPDAEGILPPGSTVTITSESFANFEFSHWLVNGLNAGSDNPLAFEIMEHTLVQAVFTHTFIVDNFTDINAVNVTGTLRHALTNAIDNDVIRFEGVTPGTSVVELTSALPQITGNINIEGNGITLTRSSSWVSSSFSQLLRNGSGATVNINRIHFKDSRATSNGAAIRNEGTLTLESCIFSGNLTSDSWAWGGAIRNEGTMTVRGCTFYGNAATSGWGGAILQDNGTLSLSGNLFYGNTAGSASNGHIVFRGSGTVTSFGYNVVDVPLGADNSQSGFAANANGTDKTLAEILGSNAVSPFVDAEAGNFSPVSGLGSIIDALPSDFPTTDFYGNIRTFPGAPGAIAQ